MIAFCIFGLEYLEAIQHEGMEDVTVQPRCNILHAEASL